MKYPFVLYYNRSDVKNDAFFIDNAAKLDCSVFLVHSLEYVKQLHNANFHLLVTCGGSDNDDDLLTKIVSPKMLAHRHLHFPLDSPVFANIILFNHIVNTSFGRLCALDRVKTRPTFSLFTPSFNSYHKILRVYKSLKAQTLLDWEWIIMDDSPDDQHFQFLRTQFINDDPRIRFYRRSANNGSIGNVKNETVGLCRGEYVLEMDHDDHLMPYVLQEAAELFQKRPDVGFVYFDCACVYENGRNQWYGDFICKGYGGYYAQKVDEHWRLVYITPNINNITLSHLVCCPNHPRIWRRQTLLDLGNYCEYLPICDDYEIILRTALNTQTAKIHKLGYIQYMNEGNSNFSLIRNAEINRIGPYFLSPTYFEVFQINAKMREKGAHENEMYIHKASKIWEREPDTYEHRYCNLVVNTTYDKQFCVLGLDSLFKNQERIAELYKDERNDFLVLENKCSLPYLQERLDRFGFSRMKCYTLMNTPKEQLVQFFKLLYLSVPEYEIVDAGIKVPAFNSAFNKRSQIINSLTLATDTYLEIGVEYGECFQAVHFAKKTGVDPDPKFQSDLVVVKTADEFFNDNLFLDTHYDVVFIDGMHQAEYLLNDINHSVRCLTPKKGLIFLDDILPFNYNEQLKVPLKHYYEKGILKYGENWTGDVWKVVYHILKHYRNEMERFSFYSNAAFRGMAIFQFKPTFQLKAEEMDAINGYDYWSDFNDYVATLAECATTKQYIM